MRSVCPPKLVWICHQLECQSFGEVDFGVERFEWIYGLYYFLLNQMDFCLCEILSFVCSVLLLEAILKALLPAFVREQHGVMNRTKSD